ncbi:MAG TPA: sulfotransferase domain-containing protein [Pirellulales bacterium]
MPTLLPRLLGRRPKEHILIACFPKSGSTYLSTVLQELFGFPNGYAAELGRQNEQDISERRLGRLRRRTVLQQHVRATYSNLRILLSHQMRPIVQTRNLFDVLASMHDHFQIHRASLSCGYISDDYLRMSWHERLDYLIHLHLPWYFNFLLSWREAGRSLEICPVRYEDLFADREKELQRIASFYGIPTSPEQIQKAIVRIATADTRFNVGIAGRGAELLSDSHKQAIYRMADSCHVKVTELGGVSLLGDANETPTEALSHEPLLTDRHASP